MDHESTPLDLAKQNCGGVARLAEKLNAINPDNTITPQAISQWRRVPAERAADVAKVSGVPVEQLRPDVFRGAMAS
jgi:DNA-binding transcriptional regulator YdaS (Cro superfamily)